MRNPSAIGDRRELEGEGERARAKQNGGEGGRGGLSLLARTSYSGQEVVSRPRNGGRGGGGRARGKREREGPPLPVIFLDSAPICPSLALTGPRLSS